MDYWSDKTSFESTNENLIRVTKVFLANEYDSVVIKLWVPV